MEPQKSPNSQSNLEKKNKAGGIMLPCFKMYYEAIVIETVWNLRKQIESFITFPVYLPFLSLSCYSVSTCNTAHKNYLTSSMAIGM